MDESCVDHVVLCAVADTTYTNTQEWRDSYRQMSTAYELSHLTEPRDLERALTAVTASEAGGSARKLKENATAQGHSEGSEERTL